MGGACISHAVVVKFAMSCFLVAGSSCDEEKMARWSRFGLTVAIELTSTGKDESFVARCRIREQNRFSCGRLIDLNGYPLYRLSLKEYI